MSKCVVRAVNHCLSLTGSLFGGNRWNNTPDPRLRVLLHVIQVEGIICTTRYFVTVSLYEKRAREGGVSMRLEASKSQLFPDYTNNNYVCALTTHLDMHHRRQNTLNTTLL